MVSCGYEPSAVMDGFSSLKGFWGMVRGNFKKYPDQPALKLLSEASANGPAALIEKSACGVGGDVTACKS
jgi:hypothetical protein